MNRTKQEIRVRALLLGEFEEDRLLVQKVFRRSHWRLFEAHNRRRALECLERDAPQVVIAESDLADWSWKQVLRDLNRLSKPPQLVVTSRTADELLWAEVLSSGGYDVLARPFAAEELERVVASACAHFGRPSGATAKSSGGSLHNVA
jgi:DNA-binding response OmpR family regulator